jgi:ParB-like chromosome segregation protein Spo0J
MNVKQLPIKDITPYANNPRKNDRSLPKVKASIKEFGFKQPIVVDKENVIIVGHTRYQASLDLGLKKVPVVVASDLTNAQVKAYRIADNKVAQDSEWDIDLLKLELGEIDKSNIAVDITGFSKAEIESLNLDTVNVTGGLTEISNESENNEDTIYEGVADELADDYVNINFTMKVSERKKVFNIINLIKTKEGYATSSEALIKLCNDYND